MSSEDETSCIFVSTRGIMKSCTLFPSFFENGQMIYNNFNININPGESIYIHFDLVEHFINAILPHMKTPFVLVSGNSDHTCIEDFPSSNKLLDSPLLLAWFSQNVTCDHPKLYHIPIGLDYHTLSFNVGSHEWTNVMTPITPKLQELSIRRIRNKINKLNECKAIACTNFHLAMGGPIRRTQYRLPIYEKLKNKNIIWLPKQTREEFWESLNEISFVICPFGNGLDTHRTWEVLMLGRIPIVEKSNLNKVYDGLPIIEVEDWNEINDIFLERQFVKIVNKLKSKEYKLERLMLSYWNNKIASYKLN